MQTATMEIFKDNKDGRFKARFVQGAVKSKPCETSFPTLGAAFDGITERSRELGVRVEAYYAGEEN